MKVLVTGGAGFIGSNLVKELAEKGEEIIVLDNLLSGNLNNLSSFKGEVIIEDVSENNWQKKVGDIDAIFHLASITDTTFSDEKEMLKKNLGGFEKILNFALKNRSKVIYASSAAVYGNGPSPMREGQKLSPLNSYARSKLLMEEEAKNRPLDIIGLRFFNVYGPNEMYKKKAASMVYQLITQMFEGKRPRLFKYGEQKRDFIYIKDVVKFILAAYENLDNLTVQQFNSSIILNVGTGKSVSFNEIVETINKVLGTNLEPDYFDNPYSFYQNNTCADMSKSFQSLIKSGTQHSLEEGVREIRGSGLNI